HHAGEQRDADGQREQHQRNSENELIHETAFLPPSPISCAGMRCIAKIRATYCFLRRPAFECLLRCTCKQPMPVTIGKKEPNHAA
ncbi:MAG: hypothetical protein WCD16_14700, partial [Paracoccaceae bacterium]